MGLQVMRVLTFHCDVPDCNELSPDCWPSRAGSQIAQARKEAEEAGWSFEPIDPRGGSSDPGRFARCPMHTSEWKGGS